MSANSDELHHGGTAILSPSGLAGALQRETEILLFIDGVNCASAGNANVITQVDMPLATTVVLPCAAGGTGETVELTGEVHAVFGVTHDANGGLHIATHFNNVSVKGIGLTTGNTYQGREAITSSPIRMLPRMNLVSSITSS